MEDQKPTPADLLNQVFAAFGEAVFDAGLFEVELRILLSMAQLLTLGKAERMLEFDRLSAKTLGGLLGELPKKGIQLDPSTAEFFGECLQSRNYLIHRFFFHHSLDLPIAGRAKEMIAELKATSEKMSRADSMASAMSAAVRNAFGYNEEKLWAKIRADMEKHLGFEVFSG